VTPSDPAVARGATEAVPGIPHDAQGPVFREPWEAQAFAMALALHERGVFSWPEWATMLATELKDAHGTDDADTGENYYHHWLAALERLLAKSSIKPSPATGTR
jgi:nitrile hydratase accessory protein